MRPTPALTYFTSGEAAAARHHSTLLTVQPPSSCPRLLLLDMMMAARHPPLLLLLLLHVSSLLQVSSAASISVNLTSRHPIDRRIYGTNFATDNLLSWGSELNRNGGDAISNWNWQLDASNSGSDWYFISEPFTPSCSNGSSNDCQLRDTLNAGASFLSTISTIGHVTSTTQKRWSFSVAYYGAQTATECNGDGGASWCASDAGDGVLVSGNTLLRNNLSWYQPSSPADAVAFVQHMRSVTGAALFDTNAILQLDNEPDNWANVHRDCHPLPLTYDELWNYTLAYSLALKTAYPGIKVAGPIWCCWWSAADGCSNGADHAAHNNMYISPWLMQQVNNYYLATGVQVLDYFDIHYYPNVPADDSTQAHSQELTDEVQSFYNASYVDPGWIGDGPNACGSYCNGPYVDLIPRFQSWLAQYAPDLTLPLAISEYSFVPGTSGSGDTLFSPALANAEVLSVFAVYRVAYAARWVSPAPGTVAETAFRLYLNYDGNGAKVTGDSVSASSSTAPTLTSYAVHNASSGALYLLLFNKAFSADSSVSVTVQAAALSSGAAAVTGSVWQFSVASQTLTAQSAVSLSASAATAELSLSGFTAPARSATLIVVNGVQQTGSSATPPSTASVPLTSSPSLTSSPLSSSSSSVAVSADSAVSTASVASSSPAAAVSSSSVPAMFASSSSVVSPSSSAVSPSSSAAAVGQEPSAASSAGTRTSAASVSASSPLCCVQLMALAIAAIVAVLLERR